MAEMFLDYSIAPAISPVPPGRSPMPESRRVHNSAALTYSRRYGLGDEGVSVTARKQKPAVLPACLKSPIGPVPSKKRE
jgi:hypothetical protein